MKDQLFPPSPDECAIKLYQFISRERDQRLRMLQRHPEKREYWKLKIANCDEATQLLKVIMDAMS